MQIVVHPMAWRLTQSCWAPQQKQVGPWLNQGGTRVICTMIIELGILAEETTSVGRSVGATSEGSYPMSQSVLPFKYGHKSHGLNCKDAAVPSCVAYDKVFLC